MKYLFLIILFIFATACSSSKFKGKELTFQENTEPATDVPDSIKELIPSLDNKTPSPKKKLIKNKTVISTNQGNNSNQSISKIETLPRVKVPWSVGERLKYEVSALGLDAAEFMIEVKTNKILQEQIVWNFFVEGKTTGFTMKIYYMNFKGESFINEQLIPVQYQTAAYEQNNQKQNLEKFNYKNKEYYVYKKKNTSVEKNETRNFNFPDSFKDPISFFYYLRIINEGESFSILDNHKQKKITVKKIEPEVLNFKNKHFNTEKLTIVYENKEHIIWRETNMPKRIMRAKISLNFADGIINLKNP